MERPIDLEPKSSESATSESFLFSPLFITFLVYFSLLLQSVKAEESELEQINSGPKIHDPVEEYPTVAQEKEISGEEKEFIHLLKELENMNLYLDHCMLQIICIERWLEPCFEYIKERNSVNFELIISFQEKITIKQKELFLLRMEKEETTKETTSSELIKKIQEIELLRLKEEIDSLVCKQKEILAVYSNEKTRDNYLKLLKENSEYQARLEILEHRFQILIEKATVLKNEIDLKKDTQDGTPKTKEKTKGIPLSEICLDEIA